MTTAAEPSSHSADDSPSPRTRFGTLWATATRPLRWVARRLAEVHAGPLGYVVDLAAIALVWMLLSVWLNVRFPLPIDFSRHFFVSIEVGVLFGAFAILRKLGIRIRWWALVLLVAFALLARLFMVADSVSHRFLYRDFRVPLDLHLVPDFFALLYDTSPTRALATYSVALGAALALSVTLLLGSFAFMARSLGRPRFRRLFAGCFALVAVAALVQELAGGPAVTTRETSARITREAVAFAKLPQERRRIEKAVAATQQRIGNGQHLDLLEGNHVVLVFVESYGRTSFVREGHRKILIPRFEQMQRSLEEKGFHVASNFITSPTFGGFSWFAHGTLSTGFKVISHLHSQILEEMEPPALADYFRDAGYKPINVAPGTTRPWPRMDNHYGLRLHYYSWEFGYRGPRYGFAPMADQFVMDFVYRRELRRATQPVFLNIALTNSHAPWENYPQYVENWSKIGNGRMLHRQRRQRNKVGWDTGENVAEAYANSIVYEMDVMQGFIENFIKDDTLVVFMGDHQPHQGVTGPDNLTWSVPIHVVSRKPEFVAAFLRRGYIRGMIPTQPLPHVGMERFLEEFLADFSSEPLAVEPGIWPPAKERMEQEEARLR